MTPPAKPPHDRKLGLVSSSGVTASGAPIRHPIGSFEALGVIRGEIEEVMIKSGFLDCAPFSWVTLAILFENQEGRGTEFYRVNRKYGDLPLTVKLNIERFSGLDGEDVKAALRSIVIKALIEAGEKFQRPTDALKRLQELPQTGKA
ncbi:Imm39 family immunity protein [Erythrobacter ani]|uniref:Immunity protein 39 n=1 Tax=Erythrobacter ani TaxID=2827235 RepID=A0ABS6SJG3_9SPHN|nr:Imm39 family immunity protein [Erythrobacter ani]MBV7265139.1 immunity protein 39 [Erythrobacter ani]